MQTSKKKLYQFGIIYQVLICKNLVDQSFAAKRSSFVDNYNGQKCELVTGFKTNDGILINSRIDPFFF